MNTFRIKITKILMKNQGKEVKDVDFHVEKYCCDEMKLVFERGTHIMLDYFAFTCVLLISATGKPEKDYKPITHCPFCGGYISLNFGRNGYKNIGKK